MNTGLVVATVAASAVWLVALGVVALMRRPAEPPVGPPTLDLGPEPPAVVNFLANGFRLTPDAVPATLLDLAARDVVELEHRGPDVFVCRLKEVPPDLLPYEERVVELLRSRLSGGIVPPEALTTGPADESSRWWKGFTKEVVADAQQRGLCREILDYGLFVGLFVAAAGPAALVALVFDDHEAAYWALGIALALLAAVRSRRTQRDTPAGLAAAARWLGVRQKLSEDEVFPTLPPITVELWERHLAHGAALGVAPGAVRPIPMGSESDKRAWTSYGGRWRAVKIVYPSLFAAAWGMHPGWALLRATLPGAAAVIALVVLAEPVLDSADGGWGVLLVAVTLVPLALVAARGVVRALKALTDLSSKVEVSGEILRLRNRGNDEKPSYYVAVDDGTSSTIRAWRVSPEIYGPLKQHQLVTATVTKNLGFVRSIRPR